MQAHRLTLPDELCFGNWCQTKEVGSDGFRTLHIVPRRGDPQPICGQVQWWRFERVFPRPKQTVCPGCLRVLRGQNDE